MHVRTILGATIAALILASPASAQSARQCITGLNAAGVKVAAMAHADVSTCVNLVRRYHLPAGMSGQQCLSADLRGKVAAAAARVAAVDASRCTDPPSFGYAGGTAVSNAGRTLATDVTADLFGPALDQSLIFRRCQTDTIRNVARMNAAQLKAFVACKKAGLTSGTIDDGASLAACLAAIDGDERGKIAKARARLLANGQACNEIIDPRAYFPGYCRFASDLFPCIETRTRCRACEALNAMDALAMDCETFDDGVANDSCGPCQPDPEGRCCSADERDACGFCGGSGFRCGWAEISVAWTHACGRKLDGTIACWGRNFGGEVDSPPGVYTQVTSGGSSSEVTNRGHSCALRPDGTAVCWGRNDYGQASPPPDVFVQLAAGSHHTCGLHPDGSVACWGLGIYGQTTPLPGVYTRLSSIRHSTCGLRTDGEIGCWGNDFGYGSLTPLPGPFIDVEAGAINSYGIRPDQTVVHWGEPLAQFDPPGGTFAEIDGGIVNGCGRRPDGTLVCWPSLPAEPGLQAPPGTYTQLDTGEGVYCAVRDDAVLVCWGRTYSETGPPPL